MDREALVIECKNIEQKVSNLVKEINKNIDTLSNALRIFCSILFSDVANLNFDRCNEEINNVGNMIADLSEEIKEYDDTVEEYAKLATALTASEDIHINLITLKNDNILSSLPYYYKIIKLLENRELVNPNYGVRVLDDEFVKALLDYLKPLYNALGIRLSKEELEGFASKYPENITFDKSSILKLCPTESDFDYASQVGGIFLQKVDTPAENIEEGFSDSDFEENSDTFSDNDFEDDEETLDEDETFNDDDFEDSEEPHEISDDSFSDSDFEDEEIKPTPTQVGGVPLLDEEDLSNLDEEDKTILIRPKKESETIEEYEEYLKDLYAGYGYEPTYKEYKDYLKETLPNSDFILSKLSGTKPIRSPYPHEIKTSVKKIKWNDYIIASTEGNADIYNGYADYLADIINQNNEIRTANLETTNLKEMIEYLKKRNSEKGHFIYTEAVYSLIELLEKGISKGKTTDEYFGVNITWKIKEKIDGEEVIFPLSSVAYLNRKELKELEKIVDYLKINQVDFCSDIAFSITHNYINGEKHEYDEALIKDQEEKFKEEKRSTSKNETEEEIKDVSAEKQPEETIDEAEINPPTPILVSEDEEEEYDSSSREETESLIKSIKEKNEKISSLEKENEEYKVKIEKLRTLVAKDNKTQQSVAVTRRISKEESSLLKSKIEIYQIIISRLFSEKLEINPENFQTILKELYEDKDSREKYNIEYNEDKDVYLITGDMYGEKQSLTISYSGFVRMAESSFEKKEETEDYTIKNGTSRITLNLNAVSPEKVDTTKAIIYSCLSNSKINIKGKKLLISTFILNQLAKKQAKAKIEYSSTEPGIKPSYELDFKEIEDKDLEIPLTKGDTTKPITINIFLTNGEEITLILEPKEKTKTKKI